MKKLFFSFCVIILTLGFCAYSLKSNCQMTESESANASMLSEDIYQSTARDINCCSNSTGRFCGIFIHETGDTIPVNYYN